MVQPHVRPVPNHPLLHQDFWVPQLHALASAATELARERKLYVALDANELSPSRDELSSPLTSIDHCGVLAGSRDEDPEIVLAQHVGRWDRWIREGRLGRALRDLEHLPRSLASQKTLIRIQLTYRAGHYPQPLAAIREEMAPGRKLDATIRVKPARFAQDANASLLAAELLDSVIAELAVAVELLAGFCDLALRSRIDRIVGVYDAAMSRVYRRIGWSPVVLARSRAEVGHLYAGRWMVSPQVSHDLQQRVRKAQLARGDALSNRPVPDDRPALGGLTP
ncbi:MAG TPA: hypothetical protein VGC77_17290 [Rhodopseudomonas sp.]|uniref:hypothetical protein n=1 Tax=Rhodopseudomonas sp. TaxID=1078 RepID=UPI002ED779ED